MTNLVGSSTLVGPEHNNVGRAVGELLSVESLVVLEELHVGSTALQTICCIVNIARNIDWLMSTYLEA